MARDAKGSSNEGGNKRHLVPRITALSYHNAVITIRSLLLY